MMNQHLGNPAKNNNFKSENIIRENISTPKSYILPCEDCELANIRLQDLLKSTSIQSTKNG